MLLLNRRILPASQTQRKEAAFFDHVHSPPNVLLCESASTTKERVQELTLISNPPVSSRPQPRQSRHSGADGVKVFYTRTGKSFPMSLQTLAVTTPPMHPNRARANQQPPQSQQCSRTVLKNEQGIACAILVRNTLSFRIYGFVPYTASQQPSSTTNTVPPGDLGKLHHRHQPHKPLYLWGTVSLGRSHAFDHEQMRFSDSEQHLQYTLGMIDGTQYHAIRAIQKTKSSFGSQRKPLYQYRVFSDTSRTCTNSPSTTSLERSSSLCGTIEEKRGVESWKIVVGLGVDPALMVAFSTILIELIHTG